MAETAVRFLAENVSQLLEYHSSLIIGAENELRWLIMDLDLLTAYSQAAAMNPNKVEPLVERRLKELVYELEDAIDSFLTDVADAGNMNLSLQHAGKGHVIAEKVKNLRLRHLAEPMDAYMSLARIISVEERQTIVKTFQPATSDRVLVALEDEEDTIIGYLTKSKEELDIISIIGMRGLGKTTLARRIYENERIAYEYPIRIWIHVSRHSNYRDVSLNILKMFSSEDMFGTSDQELFETVRACLEKEKFLLFLDDVCSHDDWKGIQSILPHSNGRSKVLITSCDNYVDAGVDGKPAHKVRFLTSDESWKLLQLEVFGNLKDCPPELEGIGQRIADKCGGLPLQIVVVGGVLAGQIMEPNALGTIELEWQKVFANENLFMHNKKSISDAVELTYSGLPDDLRQCFLYMGVFPEGYEISAWTLTHLWIAEGFVRAKGKQSLEESANQNLYDLISRNLVMVDKTNSIGEVRTCRVHDMIRAFCMDKVQEQNLFQEIKRAHEGVFKLKKCRRLCVHSNVEELLSEVPKIPSVRSFLCFYKEFAYLDPTCISSICDACNLLRVLESKSIKLNAFPTRLTELFHLRYITLSVDDLQILPQFLSELWNLQTLVVDSTSHLITVEANIWRLRHVKTNAAIVLSPKGESKAGENLQTLITLSTESCTEDVSKAAHNLKTLRIQGKLLTLFGNKFLENLVSLDKLKLVNDVFPEMAYQNPLHGLPESNCFPPCLKWLTLSNTFLKWNHMSTLARIKTLEVLKLKDNAFTGMYWNVEEDGFPSLRFLLIATADLVIWEASTDSLPSLRCLVLKNCRNLNEFPVALKSLEKLEIGRVNISVVTSARRIAEEKAKLELPFKLSVAPG